MSESISPNLTIKELFLQACVEGDLELARVLLANGADVNWVEDGGWSLSGLYWAARGGHGELLDLLLTQPGVDANIRDEDNTTPLMTACLQGEEIIVKKLRQVDGIHLNCQDDVDGYTALHHAVVGGSPGCVRALRGAEGLDWNLKDVYGFTPLLAAACCVKPDCLKILLNVPHVDRAATDENGYNAAWLAVRCNNLGCVKLLSEESSVEWNTRDEHGDTPLLYCLKQKKLDLAKVLLNNPRVDFHVQNKDGKFPETIARELDLREILDLMSSGARLKERMSECPVCFEKFSRTSEVHQCQEGHFVCGVCRPGVQACPTCRGRMMGRAHGCEDLLQRLDL